MDLGDWLDNGTGEGGQAQELFDLSLRAEVLSAEKKVWAAPAMELALTIRNGGVRTIPWWHPTVSSPAVALPGVQLSQSTGIYSFKVEQSVCQQLLDFFEDQCNYDQDGFLKMAGTQWPGYGTYPYVHAEVHLPALQQRRTTRVHGKQSVTKVLRAQPLVKALLMAVRAALGLPVPSGNSVQAGGKCVRAMHFLQQDNSQQASFSWHSDAEDLTDSTDRVHDMTTVIVSLSDEMSGMRMWGCVPHCYAGQGSAVAFHGAALHESLPRKEDRPAAGIVWKVAFFFC